MPSFGLRKAGLLSLDSRGDGSVDIRLERPNHGIQGVQFYEKLPHAHLQRFSLPGHFRAL